MFEYEDFIVGVNTGGQAASQHYSQSWYGLSPPGLTHQELDPTNQATRPHPPSEEAKLALWFPLLALRTWTCPIGFETSPTWCSLNIQISSWNKEPGEHKNLDKLSKGLNELNCPLGQRFKNPQESCGSMSSMCDTELGQSANCAIRLVFACQLDLVRYRYATIDVVLRNWLSDLRLGTWINRTLNNILSVFFFSHIW